MVKREQADPVVPAHKRLILCADDFAANASASLGIAALARAGRISATSAMVLSPRWAGDAGLLRDVRGRIDVGLHLDWTSGFAQAAGHGISLGGAMRKSVLGGFGQVAARTVIERQLDAFEAVWKSPPDHIDGHQHVQQFAGIREALVAAVQARYAITNIAYFRLSMGAKGDNTFKTRVIAGIEAMSASRCARATRPPHASSLASAARRTRSISSVPRADTSFTETSPIRRNSARTVVAKNSFRNPIDREQLDRIGFPRRGVARRVSASALRAPAASNE